jgi:hypothetical protein
MLFAGGGRGDGRGQEAGGTSGAGARAYGLLFCEPQEPHEQDIGIKNRHRRPSGRTRGSSLKIL